MSRTGFTVLMIAIAVLVLGAMWLAWRARAARDAAGAETSEAPAGELLARFPRASYVSTTPAGAPLERVAIPGLRYKGYADVAVRRDGVTIAVTGEAPVHLPAERLAGTGTARGRIGKAVERDGLSLLRWRAAAGPYAGRELESSFRFADPAEQHRFAAAVARAADPAPAPDAAPTPETPPTTQEDA